MARCARAGTDGAPPHAGGWAFCPWCGERLPTKPSARIPGRCAGCGEAAASRWAAWCRPCYVLRIVPRYTNGHTIEDIAVRRTAGRSWEEIARDFGLTRPRRGPEDVRWAAFQAWDAAGAPGNPRDWPERPANSEWKAWLASPEVAPLRRASAEAIDRWLAEVVDAP